jgi:hypothetical protein
MLRQTALHNTGCKMALLIMITQVSCMAVGIIIYFNTRVSSALLLVFLPELGFLYR